ncbi:tetratricopeptide repeat protein, partial [Paracoccaceae bacterium]|nr:tetratricopeptide repeat protein [Paracoccaceae bacterium]
MPANIVYSLSQLEIDCLKAAARPEDSNLGIEYDSIDASLAIEKCEKALKEFPDDLQVKRALARAYHKGERYKDALSINSELSKIKDLSGMFNLGYMYYYG